MQTPRSISLKLEQTVNFTQQKKRKIYLVNEKNPKQKNKTNTK